MNTVIITGGTGMVGRALTRHLLQQGYTVIILTRKVPETTPVPGIRYALWNIQDQSMDVSVLQQADHIIHLAGAGVMDHNWTADYKKEITDSRTESSKLLVDTLRRHPHTIKSVISASAIGWYGPDSEQPGKTLPEGFSEQAEPDTHFLGETCRLWEKSIEPVRELGIRLVKLRLGIVLSPSGGALDGFSKTMRFGIAAILGNGRQVVSWIDIEDLCRMFLFAIEHDEISGTYNAVAPVPVSNKTLTLKLARAMRGRSFIAVHVPSFIIRIMLGRKSIEVLKSATVSCKKIKEAGFIFLNPTIEAALQDLIHKNI